MNKHDKIFVAGHNGLVGSAILRNLKDRGYTNIITRNRSSCDLTNPVQVRALFQDNQIDYVFDAAAKVGGIVANRDSPADFIYENLMIQSNLIHWGYKYFVKKFLFLGSSCIYPKHSKIPIKEDQLMTGSLEPTNDAYATAKIAGIKMCQSYRKQYGFNAISLMPTNLYGPGDNFDLETSHVLPAMIAKFHGSLEKSKYWEVSLWGDGSPLREFLHVDDLADACHFCMQNYDGEEHINVGTGEDVSIKQLAETIADVTGYENDIKWDTSKPNGTLRKVMDVSKIHDLGWKHKISLREGIESTYEWYKNSL